MRVLVFLNTAANPAHFAPSKGEQTMASMFWLIPISIVFALIAVWAIVYAVKSNQFEDLDSPPEQIILDDRQARRNSLSHSDEQR